MIRSSTYRRVALLVRTLSSAPRRVMWLTLLCGCSVGSFSATPQPSQEQTNAAKPREPMASSTGKKPSAPGATDRAGPAAPPDHVVPPAPLDSARAEPVLNADLHRLRRAAQQRVLGRKSPPGRYALPYASPAADSAADGKGSRSGAEVVATSLSKVALPGAETAPSGAEASEAERKPSALGHFVPIENEAALDHFHKALARLAAGNDDDGKVRIMAYGASHTQADTYTGYLRAYLQSRFGDGGQGFVLLGRVNQWYRTSDTRALHRGLTIHHARYRLDGHDEPLGLFGAALVGRYAGSFGEIITSKTSPNTQFELHYFKQPDGGDFSVHVDGKTTARIQTKSERAGLGWHSFEASPGQHRIRAQLHGSGPVRLFGISAETAGAGVVVDTLGIGGSRMTSNLRWQQDCWTEALRHRSPDLVTFAYGTNEAMAPEESLASYERQLRAVLARLRKASPHVSCVLIAPFELPARAHGRLFQTRLVKIVHAQRRVSKELGCGFWDGYAFMGGEGSMRRWMLADLASTDQIHLTRRGYVYVGIALGDALMRAYDLDPARWSGLAAVATPSGPSH